MRIEDPDSFHFKAITFNSFQMPFGWIASKFGNKSRANVSSTREVPAAGRAVAASSAMKSTLYYFPVRGKYLNRYRQSVTKPTYFSLSSEVELEVSRISRLLRSGISIGCKDTCSLCKMCINII